MAVYIFDLLVGYVFGGFEYAQGYRALMLKNHLQPVKFVFTDLPRRRDIYRYGNIGIDVAQMLSMHQYLTDNYTLETSSKADDKLAELEKSLRCTEIQYRDTEIWLLRDGAVIAALLLDERDKTHFYAIHYFNHGKLLRTEHYTNRIFYTDYYVTAKSDEGLYAKPVRRVFYYGDGSVAYEQIWKRQKEQYLFPNGEMCTHPQLVAKFVKKINLSEKDIIFLDRGAQRDFLQPLFQFGKKARFMTFLHSDHYYETWEIPEYNFYLNCTYFYWCKYSKKIDTMVVSTQGQKEELMQRLEEYNCHVPKIAVVPAAGLDRLKYPKAERKRYSLITVSRISREKRIDWVIKSVIKAHQKNPYIFIEIYGRVSSEAYFQHLQDIISKNHAQTYVIFKGHQDVTDVYQNYEVYLSASMKETFGLSLLEAVGSGTAMIGLDVKYGNRLFIQPGKNGYLIDFDSRYLKGDEDELIDRMAEKIVEIFEDEERLNRFHQASYEIAQQFFTEKIAEQWKRLLS